MLVYFLRSRWFVSVLYCTLPYLNEMHYIMFVTGGLVLWSFEDRNETSSTPPSPVDDIWSSLPRWITNSVDNAYFIHAKSVNGWAIQIQNSVAFQNMFVGLWATGSAGFMQSKTSQWHFCSYCSLYDLLIGSIKIKISVQLHFFYPPR